MTARDVEDFPDSGYGESSQYAAHLDRGWALLDRGDLASARTSVEHAQEIRPEDPDACVLQGAIALAEGNLEESLRCYDRAIELDPEYLEPYTAAAQVCLFDLDDPSRALHYSLEALELDDLAPFDHLDVELMAAECELALFDEESAQQRLSQLDGLGVLEAGLGLAGGTEDPRDSVDAGDPDRAAAAEYLSFDPDGEELEDEERVERVGRILQLAVRLARLRIEAGDTETGLSLLRRTAERFDHDPDVWAMLAEAEHRHGDPRLAGEAGLRTLELDAGAPLPDWIPSPAVIASKVLSLLESAADPELAGLIRSETALPIQVADAPPPELILEGVDPRIAVLALASKPAGAEPAKLELTGIAIYRRNLARFARDVEVLGQELRYALYDELAVFFGFDDPRRVKLGLPALGGHAEPSTDGAAPAPVETDGAAEEPEAKASRRRKRRTRLN